jgi:hypothetical protein
LQVTLQLKELREKVGELVWTNFQSLRIRQYLL